MRKPRQLASKVKRSLPRPFWVRLPCAGQWTHVEDQRRESGRNAGNFNQCRNLMARFAGQHCAKRISFMLLLADELRVIENILARAPVNARPSIISELAGRF